MTVAMISSLYRVERHLPAFVPAILDFARALQHSGIAVHYLPIVNDATPLERTAIDQLSQKINGAGFGRMSAHYVPRESLYASWNRGIALTDAPFFSFWNADDRRSAAAFIEGYRALQAGAALVDFPFIGITARRRRWQRERRIRRSAMFDPQRFTRRSGVGPFFMAHRALYEQVGPFDENFRIAGDTEWAGRAMGRAQFYGARQIGGEFLIHGHNLSNSGDSREGIELNVIFMRRGDWRQLHPAEPAAMRQAWESWGNPPRIRLPDEVADFLWGRGAAARWRQYQRERRQPALLRRVRLGMAARGWIHSVEWAVGQRGALLHDG